MVTLDTKALQRVAKTLSGEMPKRARKSAEDWLSEAAFAVHEEAIKGIRKVSQGKKAVRYFPGGGKRVVTVSKPGDPFNVDTGETWATIRPVLNLSSLEAQIVGSLVAYWLEVGTSRMPPRPWLSPAVGAVRRRLGKLVRFDLKG